MQQFTVPQFIDVEDKIIGPLTVRQFVIILAAAIVVGISYKLFDFTLFLLITVIMLILTAVFAFVKINGRPFHFFMLNAFQTIRRPGVRVWNNRLSVAKTVEVNIDTKPKDTPPMHKVYKESRLAELSLIVDTKGRYQGE